MSELENALGWQIRVAALPKPEYQFRFCESRRWRTDFAWPDRKLLVEVDGGQFMKKGGHTSITGFERDREKDAEAMLLGYRVLRVTAKMIKSGKALEYIERLLKEST